jgi:hypothetical protein
MRLKRPARECLGEEAQSSKFKAQSSKEVPSFKHQAPMWTVGGGWNLELAASFEL